MVDTFSRIIVLLLAASAVIAAPTPENGLAPLPLERRACADVVVHFARGTTEAGTLGTVVGPPFRTALGIALGSRSLSFEGVDYPAIVAGFLVGGSPEGSRTMANSVIATANECPNAKIVMSGYSQGGQLVHNAAKLLSTAVQQRVVAAVIFGDPNRDKSLPPILEARRKTFCNFGDLICDGTSIVLAPHLTYGSDAAAAAAFVRARV
ncbi:hypothetical protein D9619_005197 [Psilocybe cf. subviscida]|uniref:Cutinase n=1 Tax=Psilocybe cf. subviscida TaxID=2480587 RepID=A0A8H5BWG8_9AGAR|nr:hypothetical protein D9619_005197 [Psilocybe cf. subviscida]